MVISFLFIDSFTLSVFHMIKFNYSIYFHSGYKEIVELLIQHGADIEAKDQFERTALNQAAKFGKENKNSTVQ